MVPGSVRTTRVITFVAIGGITIAAATLYFLLLRNRKEEQKRLQKKEVKPVIQSAPEPVIEPTPEPVIEVEVQPEQKIPEPEDQLEVEMSRSRKSESEQHETVAPEQVIETPKETTPEVDNAEITETPSVVAEVAVESQSTESEPVEETIERLTVTENNAEPEREPTPLEKMIASEVPVSNWAECSESEVPAEKDVDDAVSAPLTESTPKAPQVNDTAFVPNTYTSEASPEVPLATSSSYQMADSPSVDSNYSEMSNDSGRATVMPPPMYQPYEYEVPLPMYEFEVPNTLVGLIIGIHGKTIRELCARSDVRILIRPHHDSTKFSTHQICSIEGKRDDINKCLHMMRHRFPSHRFPDLNLKPVFPPPAVPPMFYCHDMMQLSLPAGAPCEIYISAPLETGHFFLQLPTHPTFPSLSTLDEVMNSVYNRSIGLPDYARPPKNSINVMCAAPAAGGWFRAVTLCYDEKQDEMLVRYVDYGGFARLPRADLRFLLRQDLLSLPFQSVECYIGDVEPIDGNLWSDEANAYFSSICSQKIISCELIGHSRYDGLPFVRLFVKNRKNETIRVDKLLLKKGYAKVWDQSRCKPLSLPKIVSTSEPVPCSSRDPIQTVMTIDTESLSDDSESTQSPHQQTADEQDS